MTIGAHRRMASGESVAVLLRAADLLAGPWRDTINAATLLGQSKSVQQAEIDSACRLIESCRTGAVARRVDVQGSPGR